MRYRTEFKRTETIFYTVIVDAENIEDATEKAHDVYENADLDSLEQYCLESNDYMESIVEDGVQDDNN